MLLLIFKKYFGENIKKKDKYFFFSVLNEKKMIMFSPCRFSSDVDEVDQAVPFQIDDFMNCLISVRICFHYLPQFFSDSVGSALFRPFFLDSNFSQITGSYIFRNRVFILIMWIQNAGFQNRL